MTTASTIIDYTEVRTIQHPSGAVTIRTCPIRSNDPRSVHLSSPMVQWVLETLSVSIAADSEAPSLLERLNHAITLAESGKQTVEIMALLNVLYAIRDGS
jgi:hypothetical protein